jgi:hypothetical protein
MFDGNRFCNGNDISFWVGDKIKKVDLAEKGLPPSDGKMCNKESKFAIINTNSFWRGCVGLSVNNLITSTWK